MVSVLLGLLVFALLWGFLQKILTSKVGKGTTKLVFSIFLSVGCWFGIGFLIYLAIKYL